MAGKIKEIILGMIIFFLIYTFLRVLFSWVFSFSFIRLMWYLIVLGICIYSIPHFFKIYHKKRGSVKWSKTEIVGKVMKTNIS